MGLIGVSDKGYPIFAIPKKNTIKFSLAKLKANPLSKIEYERIQWEGIKKEEESKKDKKEVERGKSISSVVNQEQELPFYIDDQPLIDVSTLFIPPALKGVGSTIKGIKGTRNAGKGTKFARSLTRQEVLEVVDRLPRNPKEFRRKLVNSKKELDELWEKLTKNAKELEPKTDKRYGLPIYRRELDDGTIIQYKKASTSRGSASGGETIEINSQNPRENLRSIHKKIRIDYAT